MSIVYQWNDQWSLKLLELNLTDTARFVLNNSRCGSMGSGLGQGDDGQNMINMLSGDRYFAWKNSSGTILMALAYGVFTDGASKQSCPTVALKGYLVAGRTIADLNTQFSTDGVYMWRDSSGNPMAVLSSNGWLYHRGVTFTYIIDWNCDPKATSYIPNQTC